MKIVIFQFPNIKAFIILCSAFNLFGYNHLLSQELGKPLIFKSETIVPFYKPNIAGYGCRDITVLEPGEFDLLDQHLFSDIYQYTNWKSSKPIKYYLGKIPSDCYIKMGFSDIDNKYRYILFDEDIWSKLSFLGRSFLIAHELSHHKLGHLESLQADYEVEEIRADYEAGYLIGTKIVFKNIKLDKKQIDVKRQELEKTLKDIFSIISNNLPEQRIQSALKGFDNAIKKFN